VDEGKRADSNRSNPNISLHTPTHAETEAALKQINNGKAPGIDIIAHEILKRNMETTAEVLQPFLEKVWHEEKMPVHWKKGFIIKLPRKGDITNCSNWMGITLLSVQSKVLSRILLNRIKECIEQRLRKEQAGFPRASYLC
jgi:hypothetical protein